MTKCYANTRNWILVIFAGRSGSRAIVSPMVHHLTRIHLRNMLSLITFTKCNFLFYFIFWMLPYFPHYNKKSLFYWSKLREITKFSVPAPFTHVLALDGRSREKWEQILEFVEFFFLEKWWNLQREWIFIRTAHSSSRFNQSCLLIEF